MSKTQLNEKHPCSSPHGSAGLNLQASVVFSAASGIEERVAFSLIRDAWQKISTPVPVSGLAREKPLCFIPPVGPGVVNIAAVNFVDNALGERILSIHEFGGEEFAAVKGTALRVPSRENLIVLVTGSEPVVEIGVPAGLPDRPLQIDIWVKLSRDTDDCHDILRSLSDMANWRSLLLPENAGSAPGKLMKFAKVLENAGCPDCAVTVLERGIESHPEEGGLYEALAELAMKRRDWAEAVKRRQDVAALQGEKASALVYRRLDEAYKKQKYFPKGEPEEEMGVGDLDKYRMLAIIHHDLAPELYLEIGVQLGKSLVLADCEAIGVDPMPQIDLDLFENVRIMDLSSDDFFAGPAAVLLNKKPDMVFIDGMHLFEYALRDFMNVEKFAGAHTLAVIDDIFPAHPAQAERRRKTRAWTGDVWKLYKVLQQYRPDLFFLPINTFPTGLLLIAGLKPGNETLSEKYEEILAGYTSDMQPPEDILQRKGVLPPTHPAIEELLNALKDARERNDKPEGGAS
ncbi:MAG TPA: hypothetical protein ENN79_12085, partial [Desulfobacteraceae bacterium]|nr:hypothetical protein [Desulfobacteraceae bacterium]